MPDDFQYIKLPDGSYAKFPASMPDDQIAAALKQVSFAPPDAPAAAPQTWSDKLGLNPPVPPSSQILAGLQGAAAGLVDAAQGAVSNVHYPTTADIVNATMKGFGGPRLMTPTTGTPVTTVPPTASGYIGKATEAAEELALAGPQNAIPTTTKAGALFQEVMGAASRVPVDTTEVGNVAMRIRQLADRGATMPSPVNKLVDRLTDPDKAPMLFQEARDWAANISRLSRVEADKVIKNGPMAAEIANLRVALNGANARAASMVGKGAEYVQAMGDYANAMRLREAVTKLGYGAAGAAGVGSLYGAGSYAYHKLMNMFGGN